MPEANIAQSIMAFDFGTQKMGMAIGQSSIESATPLALFSMKDGIPDWAQLLKLVKQWQPNVFLVGLPLNMDDSESELSARARKFARRLRHQNQWGLGGDWTCHEALSARDVGLASTASAQEAMRLATESERLVSTMGTRMPSTRPAHSALAM